MLRDEIQNHQSPEPSHHNWVFDKLGNLWYFSDRMQWPHVFLAGLRALKKTPIVIYDIYLAQATLSPNELANTPFAGTSKVGMY
jgi:hypothetical protein